MASGGTSGVAPVSDAGPDSGIMPGSVPSAGCGKAWTGATGMWVPQPTGCPSPRLTGGYAAINDNQGTAVCQAIPPGGTVPATAAEGTPEYRGWWVYVPNGYDPTKPHTVIYNGAGCGDGNYFTAGEFGYAYNTVDGGNAILVGLDYDTFSYVPGCYDSRDPQSNDLAFMPWLMNEIEGTLCVDTTREWMSEYNNAEPSLAQQFDCAFPARLRGQVLVGGSEPGASSYLGTLPPCNPAPTAAFYVRDFNDTDNPYVNILPGCSRVLQQNGCINTKCDPLDTTLTTPYPVPSGVTLPAGASCVKFIGCPAEYPVAFCVTYNQGPGNDQNWGVDTMFWDFISGLSPASSGTTALPPCPTPTFEPPAGAIQAGSDVVISAAGLPAGGEILFTTDGTVPTRNSPPYNAGAVGIQVNADETFHAISTTMGVTCTDSAVAIAGYTIE